MRHVIIGAGEAGLRAAARLRAAGEDEIILLNGEEVSPYERPALSKPREGEFSRPIQVDLAGVNVRSEAVAVYIDRAAQRVVLNDGSSIPYDRLLIATGARPRQLACSAERPVLELRTIKDARQIYDDIASKKRAVIVGAGLIGLELAAEFRRRGIQVTVVEGASRAMGRAVPPEVAAILVARHVAEGVAFHFNRTIREVTLDVVKLDDGTALPCDLVVSAIGVEPNSELAQAAGLQCANGIVTTSTLQTSDELIFAAGDCAAVDHPRYGIARFETWRNAVDQGAFAADAMLGSQQEFLRLPWFWSDHYELGIQGVGLHRTNTEAVSRELPDGGFLQFEIDGDGTLQAAFGVGPGNLVAKEIRLAEMLIEKHAVVPPENLADSLYALKSALKAA